jgi:hypothetical protein
MRYQRGLLSKAYCAENVAHVELGAKVLFSMYLTYSFDKLTALLGMATETGFNNGLQYIEGHWYDHYHPKAFLMSFLWYAADYHGLIQPSNPCGASWSWASLDGALGFQNHWHDSWDLKPYINKVNAELIKSRKIPQDLSPHNNIYLFTRVLSVKNHAFGSSLRVGHLRASWDIQIRRDNERGASA